MFGILQIFLFSNYPWYDQWLLTRITSSLLRVLIQNREESLTINLSDSSCNKKKNKRPKKKPWYEILHFGIELSCSSDYNADGYDASGCGTALSSTTVYQQVTGSRTRGESRSVAILILFLHLFFCVLVDYIECVKYIALSFFLLSSCQFFVYSFFCIVF